ncbi:MAG: hypothetical protein ACP5II_08175 [Infirmifilum sp.]|uniref:hypothetical protein n=1 Tax=Infirmifilum sp. TaxID=2856575 RepID=UPI003D096B91
MRRERPSTRQSSRNPGCGIWRMVVPRMRGDGTMNIPIDAGGRGRTRGLLDLAFETPTMKWVAL